METVEQNGRFTLFSCKFPSNIYSILYGFCVGTKFLGRKLDIFLRPYLSVSDKGSKGTTLTHACHPITWVYNSFKSNIYLIELASVWTYI